MHGHTIFHTWASAWACRSASLTSILQPHLCAPEQLRFYQVFGLYGAFCEWTAAFAGLGVSADRLAGVQVAVIEFARNVLDLKEAHSAEFDAATPTPAVVFMPEGSKTHKGGTMRLGARKTILQTMDCITARLYQVY